MREQYDGPTSVIRLTRRQVETAQMKLIDDLQADYPDEEAAMNIAEALSGMFGRTLLKEQVIPRIEGCRELDWLAEQQIGFAVKSSVDQFSCDHMLRIQISKEAHRIAWRKWREQ